jgi:hypothetical protein
MDDRPDWFEALADRYRVEKEIGRGGMARVYRAWDLRFDRWVAIKVLREELALALAQDRFVEEIRLAGRLNHPNIVPLYDAGVIPAGAGRPPLPWFAMMYIEGETLKERLARGPLPVTDAVDVTRAVAAALDYAHDMKVVHRDIKPANILMAGNVPVVADFGIARALDRAGGVDTLTAPGLAVGTVQYISPEQAGAEATLDHRSDVYSLGCVAYEMLAGHPPFTGPTAQAIIARHNLDPPPPLGTVRPTVPLAAVDAVERALAKKPDDRWPSAGAFAHALRETTEHAVVTGAIPAWRRALARRRSVLLGLTLVGLAAGAAAAAAILPDRWKPWHRATALTPGRYAVFPFTGPDTAISRAARELLSDGLESWDGIAVMDRMEVDEQLGGRRMAPPRVGESAEIARRLRAGRYVHGGVTQLGDSIRVTVTLYDAPTGRPLRASRANISPDLRGASQALHRLADSLLVPGVPSATAGGPSPWTGTQLGTRSLAALDAFAQGVAAIGHWELATADSAFASALSLDPRFEQAALWVGIIRSWTGKPVSTWSAVAARAAEGIRNLSGRDQGLARALAARAGGDLGAACPAWRALTGNHPDDFAVWYGLADCLAADDAVLRDRDSPSGFRFRTSRHEALATYPRAYRLFPPSYEALGRGGYKPVRGLYLTHPNLVRFGEGVSPDRRTYAARASRDADTLVLIPYPMGDPGLDAGRIGPGTMEAVHAQRRLLYETAAEWLSVAPEDPDALEVMADALDILGAPGALDSLRRARSRASTPRAAWRLAAADVWLSVKQALPQDSFALAAASRLADSLTRDPAARTAADPFVAAALAALIGQAGRAASLIRQETSANRDWQPPLPLAGVAPALLVFAALGGPIDSIAVLERSVASAIEHRLPIGERATNRARWLALAASLAYPLYHSPQLASLAGSGDYVIDAILALERGDRTTARTILQGQARLRRPFGGAVTLDALPVHAVLHDAAWGPEDAIRLLDASFDDLSGVGPRALEDPARSGSLVRALLIRGELGRRSGDSVGSRTWRRAARALWTAADPTTRGLLDRSMLAEE